MVLYLPGTMMRESTTIPCTAVSIILGGVKNFSAVVLALTFW